MSAGNCIFFAGMDWLCYAMFLYTIEYTKYKGKALFDLKPWMKLVTVIILTIDSVSMLCNIVLEHAMKFQVIYYRKERYLRFIPQPLFYLHLILCYIPFAVSFCIFLYKVYTAPHIYKRNDYYYLMIAEGGTEYCHMVTIARSKNVYGPYEACPHNPVLSNRSTCLNIKAIGHADLVEDSQGSWWAVCLGIRPLGYPFRHNLGRETMLAPVKWENGWPVMGDNGTVTETFEVETAPGKKTRKSDFYIPGSNMTDTFCSNKLHPSWNTIYTPVSKFVKPTKQGLSLCAYDTTLSDDKPKAILVRRQEHFHFTATATLTLESVNAGSEAGITIYMNNRHHYEAALSTVGNGEYFLILRRRIGSLQAVEARIPFHCNTVQFILTGDKNHYTFSYLDVKPDENPMPASAAFPGAVDAPVFIGEGEAQYLTTEVGGCFTGNYIGLYASKGEALFTEFSYQGGRS